MIKSLFLYALLIGALLPISQARTEEPTPAQKTKPSPKDKGIPAELRAKAEKNLHSMGITPEQYHAKLRECIDCKTKEDKKLAKTLILAGVDMTIDTKAKKGKDEFGEKVRAAMKHPDVMKLWRLSVADKMKNIDKMHDPERWNVMLQHHIVEWTPTRYEDKLNEAAAAAKAYGQSIKDAENLPEGDAAHDAVKSNKKNYHKTSDELMFACDAERICTDKEVILEMMPLNGVFPQVYVPLTKEESQAFKLVTKHYKGIKRDFFDKDVNVRDPEIVRAELIKLGVSFPKGAKASYNEKTHTITASLVAKDHDVMQKVREYYTGLSKKTNKASQKSSPHARYKTR